MAWQTPKTNYDSLYIVGPGDFNRIEGNIAYLKDWTYHGKKLFTTNGTFIVPSGVTRIWVSGCGGGGGGYYTSTYDEGYSIYYYAGGGGGASIYMQEISVTPGLNISITVGAGGGIGQNGGTSSFGDLILPGGKAGTISAAGAAGGDGGSSGTYLSTGGPEGFYGAALGGSTHFGAGGYLVGSGFGSGGGTMRGIACPGRPGFILIEW